MLKLISLGLTIASPEVLNTTFESHFSLLDADVLIIEPGKLDESMKRADPSAMQDLVNRRTKEIQTLLENGKIVISFFAPISSISVGSQRRGTITLTNYSWLDDPWSDYITERLIGGTGHAISLSIPQHPFAPFYYAFRERLTYGAYLEKDLPTAYSEGFLRNKAGKIVGASMRLTSGMVVFLPYLTTDAMDPKKFVGVLIQCVGRIYANSERTPPPPWIGDYAVPGEEEVTKEIETIEVRIKEESNRMNTAIERLNTLSSFRSLLYEKGKPLEEIVLRVFEFMGFKSERLQKGHLEHDVILSSEEGRAIAEVEGRDDESIHIDKLDHLTRVVDEDFHENNTYAHGILIGNPYRLKPPQHREAPFTDKVLIAVQRKGFGLLTTVELFKAVALMLTKPDDINLKARFRTLILQGQGKEIRLVD